MDMVLNIFPVILKSFENSRLCLPGKTNVNVCSLWLTALLCHTSKLKQSKGRWFLDQLWNNTVSYLILKAAMKLVAARMWTVSEA